MSGDVLFCLAGTTGDVLPGVSLAARLGEKGLAVTVATHEPFGGEIERLGMRHSPLPGSQAELWDTPTGRLLKTTRGRSLSHGLGTALLVRELQPAIFDALEALDIGSYRLVVYSPLCAQAQYFADDASTTGAALHYQTAFPTGAHGSPYVSAPTSRAAFMNQLSFDVSLQLEDRLISPKARSEGVLHGIELPERNALLTGAWERAAMHIQAVSPWLTSDVGISRFRERRTGFLPVPPGAFRPIPEDVLEARDAGKRLVYFGMGSLALAGTARIARHLEQEVREREGVLLLDRPVEKLLARAGAVAIDASGVAHDDLFKLVDVAIVAGGAGTISTALRAGAPLIVLPHWFDQFAWCYLLQQRGLAAPDTPPSGRWSRKIAAGIDWAREPETKSRAAEGAAALTGEDGVTAGAEALLELLS